MSMTHEEKLFRQSELSTLLINVRKKKDRAERLYRKYSAEWLKIYTEHEKLSYQLALESKKFEKVTPGKSGNSTGKLSLADVLALAEHFGIKVVPNQEGANIP